MRLLRSFALAFAFLFVVVLPSLSCGPFFTEAIFVQHTRPDGAYASYAKGGIGVPQGQYRVRHLVIAYDWLGGRGLSVEEQRQAVAVDGVLNRTGPADPETGPGMAAWIAVAGSGHKVEVDRMIPGDDYGSYVNCLDDAFATAARTLTARRNAYGNDPASVSDWLQGQDAVFSNCSDEAGKLPAAVAAKAPAWLQQDRACQMAAAKFYQEDYDGAMAQLGLVAKDGASPWRGTARLVMARAMIRKAMVGQRTELPAVISGAGPHAYSKERNEAQEAYRKTLQEKRSAGLGRAADALRAIEADPALAEEHAAAARLLDYVLLRLDPAAQMRVLIERVSGAKRPQGGGSFGQGLIDMTYLLNTNAEGAPKEPIVGETTSGVGLDHWIATMRRLDNSGQSDQNSVADEGVEHSAAGRQQAFQEAIAAWRNTQAQPWLIAALSAAKPGQGGVEDLVKAARAVPTGSSAWVAATYLRLRLDPGSQETRAELDSLVPALNQEQMRSTVNLFADLRMQSSPTLSAFLKDASTLPAGTLVDEDDPEAPGTSKDQDVLCGAGAKASEAETRLFDHAAATILNTRMPVRLLTGAAQDAALAPNLRFQIAQSAWTRAVLLGEADEARKVTPVLTGCYPAWKPWLEKLDAATAPDDRRVASLMALMRFASTEPIVRDGEQRPSGFATYDSYRDNWWQENRNEGPLRNADGTQGKNILPALFFGTHPASAETLPDPPFLTVEDRGLAVREVAVLRKVPCASDYFAKAALDWQRLHPADPRTPDLLGFAERAVRNGCSTAETGELNHQLFLIVQTKYPKSEWASKYPTWDKR